MVRLPFLYCVIQTPSIYGNSHKGGVRISYLVPISRTVILSKGETFANRNEYQALALWLEELASIGGKAVAKECVLALAPRYMKRPAMKDEIKKVGLL